LAVSRVGVSTVDLDHQIAHAAPVEHGHPRAAHAQLLARLDACRDLDLHDPPGRARER
jgi:hypothetical protein